MIPQRIPPAPVDTETVCAIGRKWKVDPMVIAKLAIAASRLEFGIKIISGHRTREEQEALEREGRPTAAFDRSTHTTCPATGADVWPDVAVTDAVKARLGAECMYAGLRVGGGSAVDPETGIPSDWNHVDLGPRA